MARPSTSQALHARARERGVNPLVYWLARAVFQPVALLWFRLERVGGRHVPRHGGVVLAANHRSFLDPFVIACASRRPLYNSPSTSSSPIGSRRGSSTRSAPSRSTADAATAT